MKNNVYLDGQTYDEYYLRCADCSELMKLRISREKKKLFYSCSGYPTCKSMHGCKPSGEPIGDPVKQELRDQRKKTFQFLSELGGNTKKGRDWMKKTWGTSRVGEMDMQQCTELYHQLFMIQERKLSSDQTS